MSNSERFPEAWKVYIDCVRKWEETDLKEYPEGWKYGIPNPKGHKEYFIFQIVLGKLFMENLRICLCKGGNYGTKEVSYGTLK